MTSTTRWRTLRLTVVISETIRHCPSNLGSLSEPVKDGTRGFAPPNQQQLHVLQQQLHPQQQASLRLPQQIPRQMHPQMQQMIHSQNLAFQQQQQLEKLRRRRVTSPRPMCGYGQGSDTSSGEA